MTPRQAQWHAILSGFLAGGVMLGVGATFAYLAYLHWWIPLELVVWTGTFLWHKHRYVDYVTGREVQPSDDLAKMTTMSEATQRN